MDNALAQAAAEHDVVDSWRQLFFFSLDNACVRAEHHCERLEEGFIRERDRAAVA